MNITPYLITYDYRSKNVGNESGKRTTLVLVAEEDGYCGYSEVYAAAYAPDLLLKIFREIDRGDPIPPYVSESGPYKIMSNCITIARFDCFLRKGQEYLYSSGFKQYASAGSMALSPEEIYEQCVDLYNQGYYRYKLRYSQQHNNIKRIESAIRVFGEQYVAIDFVANTFGHTYIGTQIDESFDLMWIEEPFPHNSTLYEIAQDTCKNQMIAGEWCTTYWEAKAFKQMLGNVQIDFSQMGIGFEIDRLSKGANITAIHCWGSNLSKAMGKLSYGMEGNIYLECPIIDSEFNDHIVETCGPGLGIEIDHDWLKFASKNKPVEFII